MSDKGAIYKRAIWDDVIRRCVDIGGSLLLILVLAPVFLILVAMVMLDGGPPFSAHNRIGKHGVPYNCLKFRTMMVGADQCLTEYLRYHPEAAAEWARDKRLKFDPRLTAIGRVLQNTSLVEIPQLWNVLIGDMSFVGPGPVTESQLRDDEGHYTRLVLSVKPGMIGHWQVRGRNNDSDGNRVELDSEYVQTRRLVSDIGIFFQATRLVFARIAAR